MKGEQCASDSNVTNAPRRAAPWHCAGLARSATHDSQAPQSLLSLAPSARAPHAGTQAPGRAASARALRNEISELES